MPLPEGLPAKMLMGANFYGTVGADTSLPRGAPLLRLQALYFPTLLAAVRYSPILPLNCMRASLGLNAGMPHAFRLCTGASPR